ncbi:MAG: class I SAM-dependent methyltransferase [Ignavibacteriales bacterium]|nr:class I SAM-dependent methyltransferase [Ignavibacteriales bacterium]MCF8315722.1 class I SAM-dependent methyltransferase [Ignavibacteriales bacterium]MCF8437084.1 class I SAM-dependent methyltransferase [Ignavibacteriales bacterium]
MDYIDINRKLWDNRTEIHFNSDFYDVESFVKGKDSLNPIEIGLLGNIEGKKILHLQCHFGMDTISLSRRGAHAMGVDFSAKAIEKALELNRKSGTNARFLQSEIYKLSASLDEKFDIVFTSYGVLGWLPDMIKWAEIVNHFLKPGGKLILVEFHPVLWIFSDDFRQIQYDYMDSVPIIEESDGTYADRDSAIREKSVGWNHGLSSVLDSIIKTGLIITDFKEYNYSPYNCFQNMIMTEDGKYKIKGLENKLPMLYSLVAEKGLQEH